MSRKLNRRHVTTALTVLCCIAPAAAAPAGAAADSGPYKFLGSPLVASSEYAIKVQISGSPERVYLTVHNGHDIGYDEAQKTPHPKIQPCQQFKWTTTTGAFPLRRTGAHIWELKWTELSKAKAHKLGGAEVREPARYDITIKGAVGSVHEQRIRNMCTG